MPIKKLNVRLVVFYDLFGYPTYESVFWSVLRSVNLAGYYSISNSREIPVIFQKQPKKILYYNESPR